jgi:hypothetical protein
MLRHQLPKARLSAFHLPLDLRGRLIETTIHAKEFAGSDDACPEAMFADTITTVIARLDRATQYSKALMRCNAPNKRSGILVPRFRGDDESLRCGHAGRARA